MHPDTYVPDGYIPPVEYAVISIEREIDDLASKGARLNDADLAVLRRCVNRLLTVIADAVERRAA